MWRLRAFFFKFRISPEWVIVGALKLHRLLANLPDILHNLASGSYDSLQPVQQPLVAGFSNRLLRSWWGATPIWWGTSPSPQGIERAGVGSLRGRSRGRPKQLRAQRRARSLLFGYLSSSISFMQNLQNSTCSPSGMLGGPTVVSTALP